MNAANMLKFILALALIGSCSPQIIQPPSRVVVSFVPEQDINKQLDEFIAEIAAITDEKEKDSKAQEVGRALIPVIIDNRSQAESLKILEDILPKIVTDKNIPLSFHLLRNFYTGNQPHLYKKVLDYLEQNTETKKLKSILLGLQQQDRGEFLGTSFTLTVTFGGRFVHLPTNLPFENLKDFGFNAVETEIVTLNLKGSEEHGTLLWAFLESVINTVEKTDGPQLKTHTFSGFLSRLLSPYKKHLTRDQLRYLFDNFYQDMNGQWIKASPWLAKRIYGDAPSLEKTRAEGVYDILLFGVPNS